MAQDTYRDEQTISDIFEHGDTAVRKVLSHVPSYFSSYHPDRDETHLTSVYSDECGTFLRTGDDMDLRERWDDFHFDARADAVEEALERACRDADVDRDSLTDEQVIAIREGIWDKDTDDTYAKLLRESTGNFTKSVGGLDLSQSPYAAIEAKARELGANVNHPDVRSALRQYAADHGRSWSPDSEVSIQFAGNLSDVGDAVATSEPRQFEASISVDDEAPVRIGTVHTMLREGEVSVFDGEASWGSDPRSRPRTYEPMRDQHGFEVGTPASYGTNSVTYTDGRTLTTEGNKVIETSGIRTTTVTKHDDGTVERQAITRASNFELEQRMTSSPDGTFQRSMSERSPEGSVRKYMREQLDSEGVLTQERGDGLNTSSLTKWPDGSSELVETGPYRRREVVRDSTSYRESVEDLTRQTTRTKSADVNGNTIVATVDGIRGTSRAEFSKGYVAISGTITRPDGSTRVITSHLYEPGRHIDAALELLKD